MNNIFWAAFGGAAAAGIFTLFAVSFAEWLRWFLDRPLLKVSMTFGRVFDHPMFRDDIWYIVLVAKNPHTKPVTVETFGFDYKSKAGERFQVLPDGVYQFPYELKGGMSISQRTTQQNLFAALRKAGRKPSDLKGVWFESSAGKAFRGKIPRISMRALEEAFQASAESNTCAEEGKMEPRAQREFRKDYVLLQAISCFFACFFYLQGYSQWIEDAGLVSTIVSHICLVVSIIFFLGAFALVVATFLKELPPWSERILGRLRLPIGIATIGGIAVGLLTGAVLVPHDCILFPFFLYGGFLCTLLFFARIVVASTSNYNQ